MQSPNLLMKHYQPWRYVQFSIKCNLTFITFLYCATQIPTFCFFVSTNHKAALYLRVQIWAVVGWNQSRRSEFSIIPSYDCLTERKSDVLGLSRQHVISFAIIKQHLFNFWLSIINLLLNTNKEWANEQQSDWPFE